MIRTAADLFEELRARELEALQQHDDIGHQGMIGDMYEGLSRHLLTRVVPDGLDLGVVQGKVRNEDGSLSAQMDVMVVVGAGERLPHTPHYLYPAEQVIAVMEVKKTLTGAELESASEVLKTVGAPTDETTVPFESVRTAFRAVCGLNAPRSNEEVDRLSVYSQMVFHSIVYDAIRPVRIVMGYGGIRSERGLREAMLNYIERHLPQLPGQISMGFGPAQLPTLVLSGDFALLKLNGMPLAARVEQPEIWPCFGSAHGKSGVLLLEVLWTRIASLAPPVGAALLGDDLTIEGTTPLLFAKVRTATIGGIEGYGWQYVSPAMTAAALRIGVEDEQWTPLIITPVEQTTLALLAAHGGRLELTDAALSTAWGGEEMALPLFIARLVDARLAWVEEGRWLRSHADTIHTAFLPDGRIAVADAEDPRLRRWIREHHPQLRE